MENILDTLKNMKNEHNYNKEELLKIASQIESTIGAVECWKSLLIGFSEDELMENLTYIAHEFDL